jgi:EthD domain
LIRLAYLLRRKPGLSRADFQQYWRDVHGPLVARHSTTLAVQRYTQLHTLDDDVAQGINQALTDARGGMEPAYDGVAELWWAREGDLAAFGTSAGRAALEELLDDERNFVDHAHSPLYFAHDHPQVNPSEDVVATEYSPLVKLFFPLRHLPTQTLEEGSRYWRNDHGPLIRGLHKGFKMQRYIQAHYQPHPLEAELTSARGTKVPTYAGHAEAWWNRADLMTMGGVPEAARAMQLAGEDEAHFVDFERSGIWLGKEVVFIDRR